MAKVRFQIVSGESKQEKMKLGKNTPPPERRVFELGSLHLEDKCIIGVVQGIRKQAGTDEMVQAWKKEHGVDGWMLAVEQPGSGKTSWGAVNADEAADTDSAEEKAEKAQAGEEE